MFTHFETHKEAVLDIADAVEKAMKKYHGHRNAGTAADLCIITGTLLLISGTPIERRTAAYLDEFKEGVGRVIDSFKTGDWIGDAQSAGYKKTDIKGTA